VPCVVYPCGLIRVIIPDSHGSYADPKALRAFLDDLRSLDPAEIVMLGDHVDVGGVLSAHPRNYVAELEYSYEEDCKAASRFLDEIQRRAPRALIHYIEGNHEQHLERWAARTFTNRQDADGVCRALSPETKLELKRRGIRYYRRSERYGGLAVPGTIRLGKCMFTHGAHAGKHATSAHLDSWGTNVVHGHTHRAQSVVRRSAASGEIGAWCPGTLAMLQPLYLHTGVSSWSHGYGVQFVSDTGRFLPVNVPIVSGVSLLRPLSERLSRPTRRREPTPTAARRSGVAGTRRDGLGSGDSRIPRRTTTKHAPGSRRAQSPAPTR
jgi:UDP-2,3-diacylglucosamine pyrophosphatase LpxH